MSTAPGAQSEPASQRIEDWLSIEPDGTIIARSGKVEYGQGIRTGFARIVAEELCVPTERVRVVLGETDQVPWDMGTFGSMSTATDGQSLRAAATFARVCLLERASILFGIEIAKLRLNDGSVLTPDERSASYQELTATAPLTGLVPQYAWHDAEGARIQVAHAQLDAATGDIRRLEALDIVLGRPRFSSDVRLPGMLRGRVLRAPFPGARLDFLDAAAARSSGGVAAIVQEGDFVGAVAEREEQAAAAVAALVARWRGDEPLAVNEPVQISLRRDEGVFRELSVGQIHLNAAYHVPHISHAAIGPSAAVADVRPSRVDLYVATQRPFGLREEVSRLLGIPLQSIHVHPQAMGGMFGRGGMNDAAIEAVRLSRGAGRPVLLQWTRAEEFRLSPHRPLLDADVEASLDASGAVRAWRYVSRTNPHTYGSVGAPTHVLAMTSGRNAVPPYSIPSAEVLVQITPGAVRTGALRSLAAAPNVFAIESFVDELAHASGQDPIAFRLRHVGDPRLRRVIEMVRDRSGWESRSLPAGSGLGMACAIYHGTYIAQVAEVSVAPLGVPRLERVWCAVDPGRVIWEDGARNQIEGAIQQAASWTLLERLEYSDHGVTTATWQDYPIATALDAPRQIDVVFLPSGDALSGLGEPGAVPLGAALVNAVFQASRVRHRAIPLPRSADHLARRREAADGNRL